MESQKPLQFQASALDYFILTILSVILIYIPFIGWAVLLNYAGGWFADRAQVTGKKIEYKAGFGESLKLVTIGFLLLVITLGIYSFWFYPKVYKYMADHTHFVGDGPAAEIASATAPAFEAPKTEAPELPPVTDMPAPQPSQPPTTPTAPQV